MSAPPQWEAEIAELLEAEHGLRLLDECPDKRAFLMRVLGEEQAALKASLARFNGSWVPTPPLPKGITEPAEPIAPPPTQKAHREDSSTYLLKQCLVDWNDTGGKKEKTRKEFSSIFLRFAAFVGETDQPIDLIRVDQIRGRRHLHEWLESVAREQRVERKTLAKYLAAVRAVLEIATSRGAIDSNPAMGVKLDTVALRGLPAGRAVMTKDSKHPLDAGEIQRYFARMDYWLHDHRVARAVSYWLPLLLFTYGSRPEEIATLLRDDIRVDAIGRHWIHIFSPTASPDGLPRFPKHNVSFRHLPVPDRLMELGFGEYVASIPHGQWLLPCQAATQETDAESSEGRAKQTLTYLGAFLRQVVGVSDTKKTTYSLRHTFHDELRRVEVPREVQDALTGHAGATPNAGSEYYGSLWYPEEPLLKAMGSLRHLELLPDDFPSWQAFRDCPSPTTGRQLVKK
jgi:integrase